MKFFIKNGLKENIYNLMRKVGYHFLSEKNGEFNFARPARGYPRFHLFLKKEGEDLIFNLHLDQKGPIYKGTTAHSGEYDGELVEKEAERVKEILSFPPSLP